MSVLHGGWLAPDSPETAPGFFLWGETWRSGADVALPVLSPPDYPFGLDRAELSQVLQGFGGGRVALSVSVLPVARDATPAKTAVRKAPRASARHPAPVAPPEPAPSSVWQTRRLALPTLDADGRLMPQLEGAADRLYPWQIEGLWLPPLLAFRWLSALPLGQLGEDSPIGPDLRFWSHLSRWALDLLARGKFLPELQTDAAGQTTAHWSVLLDGATDQARLREFAQRLPDRCRLPGLDTGTGLAIELPIGPTALLTACLNQMIDAQVRHTMGPPDPQNPTWLAALGSQQAVVDPAIADRLVPALNAWAAPLQIHQAAAFRAGVQLVPPQLSQSASKTTSASKAAKPTAAQSAWVLEYGLQASDDEDCWVPAEVIWQHPVDQMVYADGLRPTAGHRTIDDPQETLLMGLGLASRIYSPLEASLQAASPVTCELDPTQAYEFLLTQAWRLRENGIGVRLPESLANRGGWANRLGLKIRAATGPAARPQQRLGMQGLLNFEWQLSIGGHSLSKAEFDRLVALNMPLVEINGEWVELRPADIRAAQAFFAARQGQTTLSLEDALRISTGDAQTLEKLPVVSFEASGALEELVTTLTGNQAVVPIGNPTGLTGTLRPYQALGVGWLAFLERWGLGACLADDMGLGKSIQLLAFLLHLKQQNTLTGPVLLICPTSVLGNWEREVQKFAPSLRVQLHHGDRREQGPKLAKSAAAHDIILTSYALVSRDLVSLKPIAWQGLVLDEAQNIKNAESQQSHAVRQLDAQFRIALTGTPVENRLTELWSILDFLNPGYLGQKNFFQRRFAIPIERYGDTTSLQTLRDLVQPFILRRLKTDRSIIQDLPEKQEMTVFCGLSPVQATLYQATVDQALAAIESAEGIQRRGMILALLTKLKQLCNHPALVSAAVEETSDEAIDVAAASAAPPETAKRKTAKIKAAPSKSSLIDAASLSFHQDSGKLRRLEEMLEELLAEGDRALIFTQFSEWGKLLKTYLEKRLGQETLFLYGSTTKPQREAMVDRFQNDPQAPRLFILSLKAGGVGLNLTRANHVFHFDRWWNPAVENQATDRVFRIGQTRNVQVHKFVCTGTLEERIDAMITGKKALAEQVVGTTENWLTDLDTNQLRDLLLLDRRAILGEES
jgi:SNF2 family DNA or RNA helicase